MEVHAQPFYLWALSVSGFLASKATVHELPVFHLLSCASKL